MLLKFTPEASKAEAEEEKFGKVILLWKVQEGACEQAR